MGDLELPPQFQGYTFQQRFETTTKNRSSYLAVKDSIMHIVKRQAEETISDIQIRDLDAVSRHDFVVPLLRTYVNRGFRYLVFEYCQHTFKDLFPLPQEQREQRRILSWLAQACIGLTHLHENGIIHGNLKPSNIMSNTLPSGAIRVKIADFQLENMLSYENSWVSQCKELTSCYQAPEMWSLHANDSPYFRSNADTWSLGCFGYELITGKPLFNLSNWEDKKLLSEQLNDMRMRRYGDLTGTRHSEKFQKIIYDMLTLDHESRMSCHEALPAFVECDPHALRHLVRDYQITTRIIEIPPEALKEWDYTPIPQDEDGEFHLDKFEFCEQFRWTEVTNDNSDELWFPTMQLRDPHRILQMVLTRRSRPKPPTRSNSETTATDAAADSVITGMPAKELRLWTRFCDPGNNEELRVSVELILKSRYEAGNQTADLVVKKSRVLEVKADEFQNVLLHFQPPRLELVTNVMPRLKVKVSRVQVQEVDMNIDDRV